MVADPSKPTCICIVSPVQKYLLELLGEDTKNTAELKECSEITNDKLRGDCILHLLNTKNLPIVQKLTKQAIDSCYAKGLSRFEIPDRYMFVSEAWLPDTGLVSDN